MTTLLLLIAALLAGCILGPLAECLGAWLCRVVRQRRYRPMATRRPT